MYILVSSELVLLGFSFSRYWQMLFQSGGWFTACESRTTPQRTEDRAWPTESAKNPCKPWTQNLSHIWEPPPAAFGGAASKWIMLRFKWDISATSELEDSCRPYLTNFSGPDSNNHLPPPPQRRGMGESLKKTFKILNMASDRCSFKGPVLPVLETELRALFFIKWEGSAGAREPLRVLGGIKEKVTKS